MTRKLVALLLALAMVLSFASVASAARKGAAVKLVGDTVSVTVNGRTQKLATLDKKISFVTLSDGTDAVVVKTADGTLRTTALGDSFGDRLSITGAFVLVTIEAGFNPDVDVSVSSSARIGTFVAASGNDISFSGRATKMTVTGAADITVGRSARIDTLDVANDAAEVSINSRAAKHVKDITAPEGVVEGAKAENITLGMPAVTIPASPATPGTNDAFGTPNKPNTPPVTNTPPAFGGAGDGTGSAETTATVKNLDEFNKAVLSDKILTIIVPAGVKLDVKGNMVIKSGVTLTLQDTYKNVFGKSMCSFTFYPNSQFLDTTTTYVGPTNVALFSVNSGELTFGKVSGKTQYAFNGDITLNKDMKFSNNILTGNGTLTVPSDVTMAVSNCVLKDW